MARIPEFTRTVLPDRSVGIARAQAARAPGDLQAEAFQQGAQDIGRATNVFLDYKVREATANNATAVNQSAIEFKMKADELKGTMRQARAGNPDNFHKDFDKELKKLSNDYIKNQPSEAAKAALRTTLGTQRASLNEENLNWERGRKVENWAGTIEKSQENLALMADERGRSGQPIDDLLRDADATAISGSTIVEGPEKIEKIRVAGRKRTIEAAINGAIEDNPAYALELIDRFGPNRGGFDGAIKQAMDNEGGFTAVDGASGAPAIYGINEKWHPEAYAEAKKITDEKGEAAGKEYAKSFYKTEFWDKNKIGDLPAETQNIVLDGAINHTAEFSKKLIDAAKDGASPDKLLAMREVEYRRLAAKNPEKYAQSLPGWLSRLDKFDHQDGLPPDKFRALEKDAKAAVIKLDDDQQVNRLVDSARTQWDLYNRFANGELTLSAISNLEEEGKIGKEFSNFMRKSIIKNNPVDAEDQSQTYSDLFDQVTQLQIKTKDGKLKIGNKDASLEDLVRLQNKIIKDSVRGVTGLKPLLNKVSPAVLALADKERGIDDKGIDSVMGFFRSTETYDGGYEVIQHFLEKQGKENDLALKAGMLSDFVEQADALPEEVLKDPKQMDAAMTSIANTVIAKSMKGGMKNVPVPAIKYLMENPSTAPQFDALFGTGAANKILGK